MTRPEFDQLGLPSVPGIYFFRDENDKILYIGKATSLRERVRSYFSADLVATRGPRLVDMVFLSKKITWEVCQNALEALIIEANAIRHFKPKYNVKEKDDKSYNCVIITKEDFPRIFLARQRDIDWAKKEMASSSLRGSLWVKGQKLQAVFGPYPSGSAIKEGLKILRRIFPYRDFSSLQKDKEIFYRQIGLAPDLRTEEAQKKYKQNITRIKLFLSGKFSELRETLEKQMNTFAKREEFEEAQSAKQKLFALNHIQDVSLLKRDDRVWEPAGRNFDEKGNPIDGSRGLMRFEGYDIAHISGTSMVGVMVVAENGVIQKDEYRKFNIKTVSGANDPAALREVILRRLNHPEWPYPKAFVVDGNKVQKKVAEDALKEAGLSIPVIAVVKNEKHKPKGLLGKESLILPHKQTILLVNGEAHRFAIDFHRKKRSTNSLGLKKARTSSSSDEPIVQID
ncbi:MAG: GIY-YIG nuclease family protein [Candidatus Pacebacteria bacterium]|nr:GIY-YIG nuclease family protein [Candidatus Paceibacterota bacterium]